MGVRSRSVATRGSWASLQPYALPLTLGLLLRLWFVHHNPDLTGDPLLYGAIARNLLEHGVYGFSAQAPTLIRLPGYPLLLAACFRVFGVEHYHPVLFLQVGLDLAGCLVVARLAAQLAPAPTARRAALATLWLAALCPFSAAYTAAPLTETAELFSISAALFCFARALGLGPVAGKAPAMLFAQGRAGNPGWLAGACLAWTVAALLRPDGALLAVALCLALVVAGARAGRLRRAVALAGALALLSVLAFVPWAVRNWRTFHVFEPLAPRYATDPGEPTNPGFQRWTKTVCVDLACTSEVYWAADDDQIGIDELPSRAFDSPQQLRATEDLLAAYNRTTSITPELDRRFGELADARIRAHPARYYLALPALRLADMWFRPRVELFNIDLRWWRYGPEGPDPLLAWAFAALNAAYLLLAVAGARGRPPLLGVFVGFTLLRCALLWTIEAPEPRYTLECFPVVWVLGGLALARFSAGRRPAAAVAAQA